MGTKVGILLPRSVLYPSISFDLLDGFRSGLAYHGAREVEVTTSSIGVGAKHDEVYAKAEQLLLDGVDIIIAYINPSVAEPLQPLFQNTNRILLVLDSGYHYHSLSAHPNIYSLSYQGNLCCRVVARHAVEAGNKNLAYTCSFFDAGFRSSHAIANAIVSNGGRVVKNHVTALKRQEFTLDPLLEELPDAKTEGIVAAFCGDMAEDFWKSYASLPELQQYNVYGSSFMGEELWLDKIAYPGRDAVCSVAWYRDLDLPANAAFVEEMKKLGPDKANLFSLMSWEAAFLIAKATEAGLKGNAVSAAWEGLSFDSPRGAVQMAANSHQTHAPVYLTKVVENETNGRCRLEALALPAYVEEERQRLHTDMGTLEGPLNQWFNAYACLDS